MIAWRCIPACTTALLPKLRTLDYKRVKPAEREAAEAAFRRTRGKPVRGVGSDAPTNGDDVEAASTGAGAMVAPKAGPTEEQVQPPTPTHPSVSVVWSAWLRSRCSIRTVHPAGLPT